MSNPSAAVTRRSGWALGWSAGQPSSKRMRIRTAHHRRQITDESLDCWLVALQATRRTMVAVGLRPRPNAEADRGRERLVRTGHTLRRSMTADSVPGPRFFVGIPRLRSQLHAGRGDRWRAQTRRTGIRRKASPQPEHVNRLPSRMILKRGGGAARGDKEAAVPMFHTKSPPDGRRRG